MKYIPNEIHRQYFQRANAHPDVTRVSHSISYFGFKLLPDTLSIIAVYVTETFHLLFVMVQLL